MKGWVVLVLLGFAAFIGFMVWTSTQDIKIRAEVCVYFNGKKQCSVATGKTEAEAIETAHRTACSIAASGMTQLLACEKTAAISETVQDVR